MVARMLLLGGLMCALGACFVRTESVPGGARTVQLVDFTTSSDVEGARVIELPASVTAPPEVVVDTKGVRVGDTEVTETTEKVVTDVPGIGEVEDELGPIEFDETVRAGVRWPVDGLVGQINGRPVFAAEFFLPIEDRLVQFGRQDDLVVSRRSIVQLVRERFGVYVNSELIVAEAESGLTAEMQQGVFAWLGVLEEEVTAERGGTRFSAEQSIMDETGMTLEEFMQQQRNLGLAGQLLRTRVEPRAIVSWRDIEQAYRARLSEFRPEGTVRIGRILLLNSRDGEKIATAKAAFAEGLSFAQVAGKLDLPEEGFWRAFPVPNQSIANVDDLRSNVREALTGLEIGQPSAAIEGTTSTSWYAVLGYSRPPSRSIFDAAVQLGLRRQLEQIRYGQEQERYLLTLRRRWVNDDIRKMEVRLVEIALRRYWQG